jgi:hypothetical protein
MVITTDRRTYHLALSSTDATAMAAVSWTYPQDRLLALKRQNAVAEAAAPSRRSVAVEALRFRYAITGDSPPWRPVRVFDDGQKVYIEFPARLDQGEAPPLFVVGPLGREPARQLSRPRQPLCRRPPVRRGRAAAGPGAPAGRADQPDRRAGGGAPGHERGGRRGCGRKRPRVQKAPPETLTLRAKPRPVVRFRRGVVIGSGRRRRPGPRGFWLDGPGLQGCPPEPAGRGPFRGRPRPRRGTRSPPCPGTTQPPGSARRCRAIWVAPLLDRQRRGRAEVQPPASPAATPAEQAAEAERQRLAAQIHQAREAGVMVQALARAGSEAPILPAKRRRRSAYPPQRLRPVAGGPARQARLRREGGTGRRLQRPSAGELRARPIQLVAGSVIAASLITGLDSDLPRPGHRPGHRAGLRHRHRQLIC